MDRRLVSVALLASALLGSAIGMQPPTAHALPMSAVGRFDRVQPQSATAVRVTFRDARAAGDSANGAASNQKVVRFFAADPGSTAEASARRWSQRPGVVSARPVVFRRPVDDTYWAEQWDLRTSSIGSARAEGAWSKSTGSSDVVVAVIDTGRTNHPDLLPAMPVGWGYDMISYEPNADDGDGRDGDPTDVGDWGYGYPSSWHGTHVAGTIVAQHNEIGVRGIAPGIKLMHVRVCGWMGCDDVDIVDAIRWAAGLATDIDGDPWSASGIPVNAHPADVVNLSLGGFGRCDSPLNAPYRTAIAEARAAGTVVVVAAGNESTDVVGVVPAGCRDAITVAATGPTGARAYYSNYGSIVDIAAPGGDANLGGEILSTVDLGTQEQTEYGYGYMQGTSMATPHVTGAVALLRSIWPNSTAEEVENELRLTARAFPGRCRSCGAGLLDIAALVSRTPQDALAIDNDPSITIGVGITTTIGSIGGSGGGAITVATSTPVVCKAAGATVTGLRGGTCIITITKARTATYYSATSAPLSVEVIAPPGIVTLPVATLSIDRATASVTSGTWSKAGEIAYAWYRCRSASRTNSCTPISGANSNSYAVQRPSDVNSYLRALVTLTSDGISVTAWSNATSKIGR